MVKEAKDGIPCSNPSVFVFSIIIFFHFLNIDLYCTPIMCIDAEFAISLDPNNQELRKQHSTANGKIRFIVFQKKHHTRLFPNNTNDYQWTDNSGTVVDRNICHTTEFDFFLCSHAGIKVFKLLSLCVNRNSEQYLLKYMELKIPNTSKLLRSNSGVGSI
ncbi:uncharacterized protein [Miscanthus floridulus]|uniref:uncharacterized protein isoform X2 n=1 Tax=Miscanthus floridulus TaxID=154761 RepID=UPI00345B0832